MDAYKNRRRIADEQMWFMGMYVHNAVATAIANCLSKKSNAKYMDKPILQEVDEQNKPLSEEELQRQRELFVAKLEVMKSNFELNHKDGKGS